MRPPAAFCSGNPQDGQIHGIDMFNTPYYLKIMNCWECHQPIVRVDKTENLGPSDVGYQYATQLTITEWP